MIDVYGNKETSGMGGSKRCRGRKTNAVTLRGEGEQNSETRSRITSTAISIVNARTERERRPEQERSHRGGYRCKPARRLVAWGGAVSPPCRTGHAHTTS